MYYYFKSKQTIDMDELETFLNIVIEDEFIFEAIANNGGYIETGLSIRDQLINNIELINNDLGYHIIFLSSPIKRDACIYLIDIMANFSNRLYLSLADLLNLAMINQYAEAKLILNSLFDDIDRETLKCVIYYVRAGHNVIKASKGLYIHRNTMNYRLNKFLNETSIDLRDSEHQQLLYLYGLINNI